MNKVDIELGEILLERNMVDREQLDDVCKEASESGLSLNFVLSKRGVASDEEISKIISEHFGLPFVNIRQEPVDAAVIERVPLRIATYYKFVPVRLEDKLLTIAVAYPMDVKTQDEVRTYLGLDITMVLASEEDVNEMLKRDYGLAAETIKEMSSDTEEEDAARTESEEQVEDIDKLAEDASVIKLVNQVILEAYRRRATDIHIEPYRGKVRFRYRIDGILQDMKMPDDVKHFLLPMLSRIKIMANMNIVERRLPQDGRAIVKSQDEVLDLRISSIPTPHGESVVIRLLPTKLLYSLESLGFSQSYIDIFNGFIHKPHGIVFITGPTGSGKTTTLYACLTELNKTECKIVTIEDPIEYEMEGITQIQVSPGIGLDFAQGLRSTLRHDPNVVMVGEVRDLETAEIAVRASLTGHLVFSTLHTNDAASGITRLIDIGVEPYLIASSLEAIVAQRLVRTICPYCKIAADDGREDIKAMMAAELGLSGPGEVKLQKGAGCERCNSTGFFGRTAIYEILVADNELKDMILNKGSSTGMKQHAVSRGMVTLRQDGWQKVIAGLTTPEEVINAAPEDKLPGGGTAMAGAAKAPRVAAEPPSSTSKSSSPPVRVAVSKAAEEPRPEPQPEPPAPAESGARPRKTDPAILARRTYPRGDTKVQVHYKLLDDSWSNPTDAMNPFNVEEEVIHTSVTKDLSAGGAQIFSDVLVPKGSIFEMKIELPDSGSQIECLARVERVEEIKANEIYSVAVCFLDMARADRARVDRYIRKE